MPRRAELAADNRVIRGSCSYEIEWREQCCEGSGFVAGDIVIEFDGYPIRGIDDLHKLLTDERIGKQTPVTVIRGVQKLTFFVVPREAK